MILMEKYLKLQKSVKFLKQTFSTPISESAITGIASGMALKGHKVILEIIFGDFLLIVDQVHNGISKSLELQKIENLALLQLEYLWRLQRLWMYSQSINRNIIYEHS